MNRLNPTQTMDSSTRLNQKIQGRNGAITTVSPDYTTTGAAAAATILKPTHVEPEHTGEWVSDESSSVDGCAGVDVDVDVDVTITDGLSGNNKNPTDTTTLTNAYADDESEKRMNKSQRDFFEVQSVLVQSMPIIGKSPYEDDACAELDEDCFDSFKSLMVPVASTSTSDSDRITAARESKLENIFGSRLIHLAYSEIEKSGMIFCSKWREGKISSTTEFGWIPRKQLLLLLQQDRFAKATLQELQAIVLNTDSFELVMDTMKTFNLLSQYPRLASNKYSGAFAFEAVESQKKDCCKCAIFVARSFATMQILKKTHEITSSLTVKLKACLSIMDNHSRPNKTEYTDLKQKIRINKSRTRKSLNELKKRKRQTSSTNTSNNCDDERLCKKIAPKSSNSAKLSKRTTATSNNTAKYCKKIVPKANKCAEPSKKMIPKVDNKTDESLIMSFDIFRETGQRLNQMMDFYRNQLHDHRDILSEEITSDSRTVTNEDADKSKAQGNGTKG